MIRRTLIATATAASLLVSGCAGGSSDDTAGALLLGAVVIGLGVLAATASDDNDNDGYDNRRRYRESGYHSDHSYAGNGRCDDPRYHTSNGGRAAPGTDERDCRRYGQGRK